jgi:hypothetical protein
MAGNAGPVYDRAAIQTERHVPPHSQKNPSFKRTFRPGLMFSCNTRWNEAATDPAVNCLSHGRLPVVRRRTGYTGEPCAGANRLAPLRPANPTLTSGLARVVQGVREDRLKTDRLNLCARLTFLLQFKGPMIRLGYRTPRGRVAGCRPFHLPQSGERSATCLECGEGGNRFADTVQTQRILGKGRSFKKRPILLVSAEGLEPSTP